MISTANAINEIRIKLDDPDRAPAVAQRAEAELGYKAVAWQEANESILEALVVRCCPPSAAAERALPSSPLKSSLWQPLQAMT